MRTIGEVQYLSTLPLSYPLQTGIVSTDYRLVRGGLTDLSEQLVRGDLDAGPISVIHYLRHRHRFERLANLSVSSWGRASYGVLFSRTPVGHPQSQVVAVPSKNAGSVYLLRSLMKDMYGVEPTVIEKTGSLEELLADPGATMLYEDDALLASQQVPSDVEVWDMGDAWWQFTNTPLIYMLWVCQKGLPDSDRQAIADTLIQAKSASVAVRPQIAAEAKARTGLPATTIEGFLARFNYDFTPAHEESLDLLSQTLLRLDELKA